MEMIKIYFTSYDNGGSYGVREMSSVPQLGTMVQTPKYPETWCMVKQVFYYADGKIEVKVR